MAAKPLTPAQTIQQGEKAGLIPMAKPKKAPKRDAKGSMARGIKAKASKPKAPRDNPMQTKVRNFERQTAMY